MNKCATIKRVKTPQEYGSEDVVTSRYGGQSVVTTKVISGHVWDLQIVFAYKAHDGTEIPDQYLIDEQQHTYLDTGCKRSWCEHCGAVGHYDFASGSYKP